MLIKALDGQGVLQTLVVQGQESIVDHSGLIGATGIAQNALNANANRSGCCIQNTGVSNMWVNEIGTAAAHGSSFLVPPGAYWPPDKYAVSTGAISIVGTIGDSYAAREW